MVRQSATKDLFPRISRDLTGGTSPKQGDNVATTESIIIPGNDNDKRASLTMGIHNFDENDKLVFKDG